MESDASLERRMSDIALDDPATDEANPPFSPEADGLYLGDDPFGTEDDSFDVRDDRFDSRNDRDPFGIGPIEAGSYRDHLRKDHEGSYLADALAQNILHTIDSAPPPQPTSDHSYVMSLCFQTDHDSEKVDFYEYPDKLPQEDVFVDLVGWVPSLETARYLTMGYRVWNRAGYRLHFHGSPIEYASVNILRCPKRDICSQPLDQVPDLHVQIMKLNPSRQEGITPTSGASPSSENVKPWDVRLPRIDINANFRELLDSFSNNIARLAPLFNDTRLKVARPCYALDDGVPYQAVRGTKSAPPFLSSLSPPWAGDVDPRPLSPSYPSIGVDESFLAITYPATHVTVRHLSRDAASSPVSITTSSSDDALCTRCQALDFDELLEWGMADLEIDLGTDAELQSRTDCPFCRLLSALCADGLACLRRREDRPDQATPYGYHPFALDVARPFRAEFVRNALHCNSPKPFLVLVQGIHREYVGPVVALRNVRGDIRGEYALDVPTYIDFGVVKRMVRTCDERHGPDCGRKLRGEGARGADADMVTETDQRIVLIDVDRMCLVELPAAAPDRKYLALSYVWGTAPMFTTTSTNFAALQVLDALRTVGLCAAIRDTVSLARGLGAPYLWVDTLCIIQDSPAHKAAQIARMARIYGSAWLTVVSLAGRGGTDPLPGVSGCGSGGGRDALVEAVRGRPVTACFPGLAERAQGTDYEQRAWTFQERVVSRRCLFVGERQVWLDCGKGDVSDHEVGWLPEMDWGRAPRRWDFNPLLQLVRCLEAGEKEDEKKEGGTGGGKEEDAEQGKSGENGHDTDKDNENEKSSKDMTKDDELNESQEVEEVELEFPSGAAAPYSLFQLAMLNSLVAQYSIRRLTYASDIENAWTGVQDVMADRLGWQFVAGLPTGVFDWALLWMPLGQLEPRTWEEKIGEEVGRTVAPPSWSWFGWMGQVSYSLATESIQPTLRDIEPLVKDYVVEWEGKGVVLERRSSAVWSEKTQTELAGKESEGKLSAASTLPRLTDGTRMLLRFEANAVPSNDIDFGELDIEWLNASTNSSNLRGSLRNGYVDKVMGAVRSGEDARKAEFDLLALSRCTVRTTIRGGTFDEEKHFDDNRQVAVMLVRWLCSASEKRSGAENIAKRVAIGYLNIEKWEALGAVKKKVHLV